MIAPGLTIGDRLAQVLARGPRCRITFSTQSAEIGDVTHHEGGVWVLSTPNSQHFFTLGEVIDVQEVA